MYLFVLINLIQFQIIKELLYFHLYRPEKRWMSSITTCKKHALCIPWNTGKSFTLIPSVPGRCLRISAPCTVPTLPTKKRKRSWCVPGCRARVCTPSAGSLPWIIRQYGLPDRAAVPTWFETFPHRMQNYGVHPVWINKSSEVKIKLYFVLKWYIFCKFFNFCSQDSWGDKIKDMHIWAMFIFY